MTECSRQTLVTGQIYGNVTRISAGEVLVYVRLGRGNDQQVRCIIKGLSDGFITKVRGHGRLATVSATGRLSARYGRNSDGLIEPEIVCQTTDDLAETEPAPYEGTRASVRGAIQLHVKGMLRGFAAKTSSAHVECARTLEPFRLDVDLSRWLTQRLKSDGADKLEAALKEKDREITAAFSAATPPTGKPGETVVLKVEVEWFNLQA